MRLIDADELKEHKFIEPMSAHSLGWNDAIDAIIENAPTIETEPVTLGWWEKSEDNYYSLNIWKCSVCREEWCFEIDDDVKDLNFNYCPNCGAKMIRRIRRIRRNNEF